MKPMTHFVDVDGVVLRHWGCGLSGQLADGSPAITATLRTLDTLERCGDHIVLVTARPETYRAVTERQLQAHRVPYHQLVMGITSGARQLVNDSKPGSDAPTALAITVGRNEGWTHAQSTEPAGGASSL